METIKANCAFLCNHEVMQILQELKDNTQKKHKREGSLATVTYETVHYLQGTECKNQNGEAIQKFLEAMKNFKVTKIEKLMMVNNPPRTEVEIQLVFRMAKKSWIKRNREIKEIVQESEERLTEDQVKSILDIVQDCFPEEEAS